MLLPIMQNYNADVSPNPDAWLDLDESDRIDLVRQYHADIGDLLDEGANEAHASIHVMVENQIAEGFEDVPETVERLVRQGLSRHEAIHAVGAVLAEMSFDVMTSGVPFDTQRYRKCLEKLSAKRWLQGKY